MKILLPPSEGKTAPSSGPSLDLGSLIFPQLNAVRSALLDELESVCTRDDAASILGVGVKIAPHIRAQVNLREHSCAPAWQVYSGVLFEAMNLPGISHNKLLMDRADQQILIFSGLFGVTKPSDLIPAYRLAMGVKLPQMGNTASVWKRALCELPLASDELVVDCRSGVYDVWTPAEGCSLVTVGAVREKGSKRTVVSHNAKYARGVLAGELIRARSVPHTPQELAEFAHILVEQGKADAIELAEAPASRTKAATAPRWQLTIVHCEGV